MKVFTCNDFEGHWPVGTAAIIVAETEDEAIGELGQRLLDRGLPGIGFSLNELDLSSSSVLILCDGNY